MNSRLRRFGHRGVRIFALGLSVLLLGLLSSCAQNERHFEKAKKLVGGPSATPTAPTISRDENALDLRSADVESERYLPVQERLARRQRTIGKVLARFGPTRSQ